MSESSDEYGVGFISPRKITFGPKLGEGSFGEVFKGEWKRYQNGAPYYTDIAIKIVRDQTLIDNAWDEAHKMNELDHQNILMIYGVCNHPDDAAPWMIMEYMPCGDLWNYLYNRPQGCPSDWMWSIAQGIASGMDYLHNDANQIHGDLAARNCLLGHNDSVKIGDFGKFNDNYSNDYCYGAGGGGNLPFPMRWMPPENVAPAFTYPYKPKFSKAGDVWAYGVVLFEIWTRATTPYDDLTDDQVRATLAAGNNPYHFTNVLACNFIRGLMDHCWTRNVNDRTDFAEIVERFGN